MLITAWDRTGSGIILNQKLLQQPLQWILLLPTISITGSHKVTHIEGTVDNPHSYHIL
jgi:hypothetical protein